MSKLLKASTYGKGNQKKQVSQRPAPKFRYNNWYDNKFVGKELDLRKEEPTYSIDFSLPVDDLDFSEAHFEPHMSLELGDLRSTFQDVAKFAGIDIADEVVSHVEGIIALLFTLQGCRDYLSMSSAIYLYIKNLFDRSIISVVMEYVAELFTDPQDGEEDEEDVVQSVGWLEMMKNLRTNWTLVRENKLFTQFSKLLGLVVVLELCEASSVTFSIKDYKVWTPDMNVIHGSALDVIDAIFSTVTFFVERFSLCLDQKSLKPLIVEEDATLKLDEEFATIVSWWSLVKNGNLERVHGKSDHEFDDRLTKLTTEIKTLMSSVKSFERKLLQDKFVRLLSIRNDFITMKMSSGLRAAPFCIELFGASSQGKSTFAEQIIHALLTSADLPTGKEFQATFNAGDDYMSSWKSNKLVLIIDDIANGKSAPGDNDTRILIDVCNNTPFYANMAALDEKNKNFVEPVLCVLTTNEITLGAGNKVNHPHSVQRRPAVVATVKAKEDVQRISNGIPQGIDRKKVDAYNAKTPNAEFDDIWCVDLQRAVAAERMHCVSTYETLEWNGKKMENCSFREVVQFLIEEFHAHRASQKVILERVKMRSGVKKCGVDGCVQIRGWCDKHPVVDEPVEEKLDKQFGEEIAESIDKGGKLISKRISRDLFGLDTAVEGACTLAIMTAAKRFYKHWDWMMLVPTPWLSDDRFYRGMMFMNKDRLKWSYIRNTALLWGSAFTGMWFNRDKPTPVCVGLGFGLFAAAVTVQKSMFSVVQRDFRRKLVNRNTITPMLQTVRDSHVEKICKAGAIVGALYAVSRVYKAYRKIHGPQDQGSLEPKTAEDVKKRDSTPNVWTTVVPRPLPVYHDTATTTADQLLGLVDKNLVYGSVDINGTRMRVDGQFLKSNVVLVPDHYFEVDVLKVTFYKANPEASGGRFDVTLSRAQSWLIPGTDVRMCYASSGGSFKDLTRFLTDDVFPLVEYSLLWRGRDGKVIKGTGVAKPERTSNRVCDFDGYVYDSLSINTFKGMCGAPLVARTRPILLGIHLGGVSGTPRGCAGIVSASAVKKGLEELKKLEGVIISGSAEHFEAQVLGVKIIQGKKIHPKSPLNYMPAKSQIEYYGQCPGMSVFRSDVKVTPISEHVTDVTGSHNIYGPPTVEPQYKGWQDCLESISHPADSFDPNTLITAIRDYKEDCLAVVRSNLWKNAKPLSDHENLCGIPGVKFMDAINLNSSIGFPKGGPKRRFVLELEPTEDKPNNRIFDEEIMAEIKRCHDCYKQGDRAYVIAKACKKDEVLSKPKCRIFYGNGIALTFNIRKYFLPILRIMQCNPITFESAVGVNCHGPEWQELHDYMFKYGEDRLIAGDYGKYDQKLPSQVIFAALRILIDFAKECDYTQEDIDVMEAMCGDIVYSIIAFNGDLIGLTAGTWISGTSITVAINGVGGSLNQRAYFYTMYPPETFETRKKFREHVALITYGDDNGGSVHSSIDKFTIKGCSEFLAKYGQKYTMPDKESELVDFLPKKDFEFLKRSSVYHDAMKISVGALAEKSCFKMLHCYVRGKGAPLTEDLACAQNIDTALREWFNHGPEVYELRRGQMREVATRAGIKHLCSELDTTYDAHVLRWKLKYDDDYKTTLDPGVIDHLQCFEI